MWFRLEVATLLVDQFTTIVDGWRMRLESGSKSEAIVASEVDQTRDMALHVLQRRGPVLQRPVL